MIFKIISDEFKNGLNDFLVHLNLIPIPDAAPDNTQALDDLADALGRRFARKAGSATSQSGGVVPPVRNPAGTTQAGQA